MESNDTGKTGSYLKKKKGGGRKNATWTFLRHIPKSNNTKIETKTKETVLVANISGFTVTYLYYLFIYKLRMGPLYTWYKTH